jgi:hypothetical protein
MSAGDAGISLEGSYNTVNGNTVEDCSGAGIYLDHPDDPNTEEQNIIISNNAIQNVRNGGIIVAAGKGTLVKGNSLTAIQKYGIRVIPLTAALRHVRVTGNVLRNIQWDGITAESMNVLGLTASDIDIDGNTIVNANTGLAESFGILVNRSTEALANVNILNNRLVDDQNPHTMTTGIRLSTSVGSLVGVRVVGNSTSGVDVGLSNNASATAIVYAHGNSWNNGSTQGLVLSGSAVSPLVTVTNLTTAGDVVYTAAQWLGGFVLRDPNGASRFDLTPSAAALVAVVPGAALGQAFEFTIRNTADGPETITVTAGANVTLSGTMAIEQNHSKRFLVVFSSVTPASEAVTIFSLGSALH